MSESRLSCLAAFYLVNIFIYIVFVTESSNAEPNCSSSCGNYKEVIVKYPFRFRGDPEGCGIKIYCELDCENGRPVMYLGSGRYYVLGINYDKYHTIRLIDEGIQEGNYSSLPFHILTPTILYQKLNRFYAYNLTRLRTLLERAVIANIKCENPPVLDLPPLYDDGFIPPPSEAILTVSSSKYILFGTYSLYERNIEIPEGCGTESIHLTFGSSMKWPSKESSKANSSILFSNFHTQLANGFELDWMDGYCGYYYRRKDYVDKPYYSYCRDHYIFSSKREWYRTMVYYFHLAWKNLGMLFFGARFFCGLLFLCIYLNYKCRRRHLSAFDAIESFLQTQNNLVPLSYSYWQIRTMTKGFKDKLGEGGFGSVYKGKLRSGNYAAIKMLGKSKANGQDFINEVATIGRIHHVNVVQLIGFCSQGSKRALVYDFMPNGSLEKYISSQEGQSSLSCEQMYNISLGIARGIEYLHRGCDMQILHFDIKPHNILLDKNFTPKVSDFGLAKLYPTQNSIVSLTAARGTMGYMAPELFYKNIGGISFKADVYSFGMLLMEMAGRRRNLNLNMETFSQIYFPSWIYDQFKEGKEVDMGESGVEEVEMVKKMVIVALWCIQLKPSDRPPMNKALEMLEGSLDLLQMPPKPFLTPYEMPNQEN